MKKHVSCQFSALLLAAFALAGSCTNKPVPQPPPKEKIGLETAVWQLTSILADAPMQVPDTLPVPITVKFSDGNVEGFGGCNSFGGKYTVADTRLTIGSIRITRMFCEGASEWENQFVQRLEKSQTFKIDGERLEISSGDTGGLVFRLNWKKR